MTGIPSRAASRTAIISALRVHDEDGPRHPPHLLNTGEILVELETLPIEEKSLFLRIELETVLFLASLQLAEASDLLSHGLEVGQHAAQPTLGHPEGSGARRFGFDDASQLHFGAHEEDLLPLQRDLTYGFLRRLKTIQRLPEVDDMDPVTLRENERAHLGIPTAGLVSEVHTSLEHLIQSDLLHFDRVDLSRSSAC